MKQILAGIAMIKFEYPSALWIARFNWFNYSASVMRQEDFKCLRAKIAINCIFKFRRKVRSCDDNMMDFKRPLTTGNVITNIRDIKSNLYSASKRYSAIHSSESLQRFVLGHERGILDVSYLKFRNWRCHIGHATASAVILVIFDRRFKLSSY